MHIVELCADGDSECVQGLVTGPDLPAERVIKIGNAALEGATIMLLSKALRRAAETLVRQIEHVELETAPDFFDFFVEGCQFKPLNL
jgi:uncharacterized 2Fe-2S/4Fe-4S cluster protein (DUF4445 family)